MPLVTVLMAVYNGEKYLTQAIDSILQQSLSDFEFLIIDDASTDSSSAIIRSYQDKRIRLIYNQENSGLAKSLNKGIRLAQGKYIARMDADDISLPNRLNVQVDYMERHNDIGISGTWFRLIERNKVVEHPCTHKKILTALFENNAIGHPTAIFRKSTIINFNLFYHEDFPVAQDYELWTRASGITQLANIPQVLVLYRDHTEQVSTTKKKEQRFYAFEAKKNMIKRLLGEDKINTHKLTLYKYLFTSTRKYTYEELKAVLEFLNTFIEINRQKQMFEPEIFYNIVFQDYRRLCFRASTYNLVTFRLMKTFHAYKHLQTRTKANLFLQSLKGTFTKK